MRARTSSSRSATRLLLLSESNGHLSAGPSLGLREPSKVVVRGASSLGRDHACPDRCLRRAGGAEDLALPRLDYSLEHLATLARLGIGDADARDVVAQFCIPVRIGARKFERALRDKAEPSPLEVRAKLKDFLENVERARVALPKNHPAVLVLDLGSPLRQLAHDH